MELKVSSTTVVDVRCDHAVTIFLSGGSGLQLEGEMRVRFGERKLDLDLSESGAGGSGVLLEELVGKTVKYASADESGNLTVDFSNGWSIEVAANNLYESWNQWGPSGIQVVSTPGGQLETWN